MMKKKRRSPHEITQIQKIMQRTVKRHRRITFQDLVQDCYKAIPINPNKPSDVNLLRRQLPQLSDVKHFKERGQFILEWKPQKKRREPIVPPQVQPEPQRQEKEQQEQCQEQEPVRRQYSIEEVYRYAVMLRYFADTLKSEVDTLIKLVSEARDIRRGDQDDGQGAAESPDAERGE